MMMINYSPVRPEPVERRVQNTCFDKLSTNGFWKDEGQ